MEESLDSLLASLKPPLPPILPFPALHRGDLIEIEGPASSGKTHLLYHLLSSLLLADSQIAAIVYDTDASFDVLRFRRLLLSRISRLPSCALDPHEYLRRVLPRLHVFRPTSLLQLAASIAHLSEYHSSHVPNQEIAVIAVDSISAFHWADRLATEQSRHIPTEKANAVPILAPLHHVFTALRAVWRSHRPLTLMTNWALHSASSHSGSSYKHHLHPFPLLEEADPGTDIWGISSPFRLAHHISLSSPPSDAFPLGHVPLDQASSTSARHVRGLMRSPGNRDPLCFALEITDDDVLVQPQNFTDLVLPNHE